MTRIVNRPRTPGFKCCAFTGHRPGKLPYSLWDGNGQAEKLKERISSAVDGLIAEGFGHFVSGGALGIDTLAALIILEKREKNPFLTLEIAVPFPEQDERWTERDKAVYRKILSRADIVTTVSCAYNPHALRLRNEFMLETCDALIAVFDGSHGGTYQTVSSAYDKGIRTIYIKP